jgi:hypothetical protein
MDANRRMKEQTQDRKPEGTHRRGAFDRKTGRTRENKQTHIQGEGSHRRTHREHIHTNRTREHKQ